LPPLRQASRRSVQRLQLTESHPYHAPRDPCLHLYPAHPQKDGQGTTKPFNRAEFDTFQEALALFRDPEFLGLKRQVCDHVASGRNRLIALGSSDLGHKQVMRACLEYSLCRGIIPIENRAPFFSAKGATTEATTTCFRGMIGATIAHNRFSKNFVGPAPERVEDAVLDRFRLPVYRTAAGPNVKRQLPI
jgi:hypothetical protein